MIVIRKSNERGRTISPWLKSLHTFSFADYRDANFMGFGNLRVINEDTVQASQGFATHGHRDMEIISYVIEGELVHQDSMGNGSIIKAGEIQKMSAGTGVTHSEYNHSPQNSLHFLQVWIKPNQLALKPSYEQISILKNQVNQLLLIGSPDGRENSITIHQAVKLFNAYLTQGSLINYLFENNHDGWIQLIKGQIKVNDHMLNAGDGVAIKSEPEIHMQCLEDAELILFDLG